MRPSPKTAVLAIAAAAIAMAGSAADFADHFEDATLRLDLFQYGDSSTEGMAVDRLIRQGTWAGPVADLVDPLPYGRYIVRLTDPDSGQVLVVTRFDSLFGEYRTTAPAAAGIARVFHETVLLPYPSHPVRLSVAVDPGTGAETPLLETVVDPAAVGIAVEPPRAGTIVVDASIAGDPHDCLDIVIVGEGYTADLVDLFRADLARFAALLLEQRPYADWRHRINLRGVVLPSDEAGCDEPTRGLWRSTSVGASFNTLGSPRYLLTEANRDLRDIAASVPYDTLIVMVNHARYGGGGIYNRGCTFTAHGAFAGYLLLHELGHSFGGLADEYYTSSTAYENLHPPDLEPVQPNITAAPDRAALKWGDLVALETPLPTPWPKERFDTADLAYQEQRRELDETIAWATRAGALGIELDALADAAEQHAQRRVAEVDAFVEASGLAGTVGAFEGAGYLSTGLYRPAVDCLMFSRGVKPLCDVCRRAVERRIRFFADE
ncbi:MAG: IgA Peptidase M64 [Thermoanaerobaculales bacterium]|jgi:hypothetical protein|nr:IgA Peptidase M64 [Thermoanaerobaculales bacterium]